MSEFAQVTKKCRNKYMTDFQLLSRRQIELGLRINNYRRDNSLSQAQFASIASVYGQPQNIKFGQTEISNYEMFKIIPSEKKMRVLLMVLKIDIEDLDM